VYDKGDCSLVFVALLNRNGIGNAFGEIGLGIIILQSWEAKSVTLNARKGGSNTDYSEGTNILDAESHQVPSSLSENQLRSQDAGRSCRWSRWKGGWCPC